jgi:hypothetical protein
MWIFRRSAAHNIGLGLQIDPIFRRHARTLFIDLSFVQINRRQVLLRRGPVGGEVEPFSVMVINGVRGTSKN